MLRRKKLEKKPKQPETKVVGGGEVGSVFVPGRDTADLPDSARDLFVDIGGVDRRHLVPRRR